MNRTHLGAAIAVAIAAAPSSVQAQSLELFVAPSGRVFTAPKSQPYPSAAWFAEIDVNRDGSVSQGELTADFVAYFDTLDGNKDNILSVDEIRAYENGPLRGIVGPGGSQTRIGQQVGPVSEDYGTTTDQEQRANKLNQQALSNDIMGGAGRYGLIPIPQPVASMDMDFDGRVSRAEMQMAATRRFKLIAGGERSITLERLPKTAAQRR